MKRWLDDPHNMRRVHKWLAVFWMVPVYPVSIWAVYHLPPEISMVLLQGYSLYALTSTHWSAYQAARTEERQVDGVQ